MSKRYFFDTSALIKLYHDEIGTDDLLNLIAAEDPDIVISDLTTIEIVSAFAKKVRMNEIGKDLFEEIIIAFKKDIKLFQMVTINKNIKLQAVDLLKNIGTTRGLKTLDALQLSCALYASKNETIELFIVSDKILAEIAKTQGINVYKA